MRVPHSLTDERDTPTEGPQPIRSRTGSVHGVDGSIALHHHARPHCSRRSGIHWTTVASWRLTMARAATARTAPGV